MITVFRSNLERSALRRCVVSCAALLWVLSIASPAAASPETLRRAVSNLLYPPPLPHFSHFHPAFRPLESTTREGDIRSAFFLAYDEYVCEYLSIEETQTAIEQGREVVAALFVTPYPPGFPILVPGQVVTTEILEFMRKLDVKEIHGYRPELGLKVFTLKALDQHSALKK